jgi:hypothetical protein
MPTTKNHPFSAREDSGFSLMARIKGQTGSNITQASISTITATFYNIDDEDAPVAIGSPASLTVASVVFDTLQTDSRWTKDATGYNFRYDVPATRTGTPCKMRVEIKFVPTTGEPFHDVWEGTVAPIHAS